MRVGAVLKIDASAVWLLGYGTYAGREVPEGDVTGLAKRRQEQGLEDDALVLDSGAKIYGGECWWASENTARALVQRYLDAGHSLREVRLRDGNL